jgi:hypothetical protein
MSEALDPLNPPHALYNIHVYNIPIHTGKGGGEIEPEKRLEGRQFTKLGRKYKRR